MLLRTRTPKPGLVETVSLTWLCRSLSFLESYEIHWSLIKKSSERITVKEKSYH